MNANLFRAVVAETRQMQNPRIVAVGKKAREFALKAGIPLVAEFTGIPDRVSLNDILPITEVFVEGFLKGEFSSVKSMHMQFESTLKQVPELNQILPISTPDILPETAKEKTEAQKEYVFEPNPAEILDVLLPFYTENGFFQIMLEAKASEHSARMVAMKSASDNAKEIVGSLKLEYNKSRQAGITSELLDITTASMTMN